MDPSKPQETIIASPIPSSLPSSQVPEPTKTGSKLWMIILAVVVVLALIGGGIYAFISMRGNPQKATIPIAPTTAPSPVVDNSNVVATNSANIATDSAIPLYPGVKWGSKQPATFEALIPRNSEGKTTQKSVKGFKIVSDPLPVSEVSKTTNFYLSEPEKLGWVMDDDNLADGPGGSQYAYKKGGQILIILSENLIGSPPRFQLTLESGPAPF